jgi:photosystem II stability/assembly factor-like uncharacterized protein
MKKFSYLILLLVIALPELSLAQDFSIFKFRNVGPLNGGRATAVAGTVAAPNTFYLGATGGGVWKSEDYGTTWNNVSDGFFKTPSIGAIAIDQKDPNIVYVGTGTDGLRSNVIEGYGVYKSNDGGTTWQHIGLPNVGQIGAVEIHPDNHNIVYVAAVGNAFKSNAERGIYKTIDGGATWQKVLYISDKVGFRDVVFLPGNPEILYASAWKAERKPWTIISGGVASEGGIYKSVNGGKDWNKLSEGLPEGLIGKIDLAVSAADSKVLYALIEAPDDKGGVYKSVDQGMTFSLTSNKKGLRTRPFYYTNIEVDPTNADKVYVMATNYYRSDDGGMKWTEMYSPHGDNHDMWINPENPDLFIQSNDGGANVTHNGGKTWSTQFNQPTSEIYQVAVDNQYPYWLYGGMQDNYTTIAVPSNPPNAIQASDVGWIINTGGCETGPAIPNPDNPNIVYTNCKGRFGVYNKITGTEKAYYVGASNMYGHNPADLQYRFQRVSPVHVSPHDATVIYHTSQFVHRTRDEGKTWETISPDLTAFEEDKQVISGSPITRDITGEEFYSTIYAIRESPIKRGVIWTGANDGPVYVTTDDGANWKNVTPAKLPAGGRVDAVEPSPHDPAKAYIAVLRYQLGDRKPYIYKTTNYGKNWTLLSDGTNGIANDIPVRVVREHPHREGLLFAGTDEGLFVSFDDGIKWHAFQQNLPLVPITDIKIHQGDLVMSTMGRGFWIGDNISTLENYNLGTDRSALFIAEKTVRNRSTYMRIDTKATPQYERPGTIIDYYLAGDSTGILKLEILDANEKVVNTFFSDTTGSKMKSTIIEDMNTNSQIFLVDKSLTQKKGLNRFAWDMTHAGPWHKDVKRRYKNGSAVIPGIYTAKLYVGAEVIEHTFELVADPRLAETNTTLDAIAKQNMLALKVEALVSEARKLEDILNKELSELKKKDQLAEGEQQREQLLTTQLATLRAKDIIYPQPQLIDQIEYLYYMLDRADQMMGKDVYDRLEVLTTAFEQVEAQL